jgi:hypothetical protein
MKQSAPASLDAPSNARSQSSPVLSCGLSFNTLAISRASVRHLQRSFRPGDSLLQVLAFLELSNILFSVGLQLSIT